MADDEDSVRKMLAAADMALFFAPATTEDLKLALRYGVVPVSMPSTVLENYNPVQEAGNAFTYEAFVPCVLAILVVIHV